MSVHTPASAPYPESDSGEMVHVAKPEGDVHPLVGDVVYVQDARVAAEESERQPQPSRCARVTTLVLISLALLFTIATLGLLVAGLAQGWACGPIDEYEIRFSTSLLLCILGSIEAACSIITLIVCVVMTVVAPRRVLTNRRTHGMNCMCATIFLLAVFSMLAIAGFAVARNTTPKHSDIATASIVISAVATVLKFAYFVDLIVVKCSKSH